MRSPNQLSLDLLTAFSELVCVQNEKLARVSVIDTACFKKIIDVDVGVPQWSANIQ
jgi:hypothetical protein